MATCLYINKNIMKIQELLEKVKNEMRLRNFSLKTIKSYLACLGDYFRFAKEIKREPDIKMIKNYLLNKQKHGLSAQSINIYLQAIKYFYREICKSNEKIDIKFAKTPSRLPIVLSRAEIEKILENIINRKHKLMVALAYGCGFRVSEVINLKIKDIGLMENIVHIKGAKGNKDRITVLPEKFKNDIMNMSAGKEGNEYLFSSQMGGKLTTRTAQVIFEKGLKAAGIKKDATFHSLRHSFATHLLENGVGVRYVQELLGHQNIRTTQLYTKVTNPAIMKIKSPLD